MARHNVVSGRGHFSSNSPESRLQVDFSVDYGFPEHIDSTRCDDSRNRNGTAIIEVVSFDIIDSAAESAVVKATLPVDWQKRWLNGVPCSVPCWEGITPGLTTMHDAFTILRQSPLTADVSLRRQGKLGSLHWNWRSGQEGGWAYFSADDPNEIITDIDPSVGPMRLGDAIAVFGEPTDVVTNDVCPVGSVRFYEFSVAYRSRGLKLNRLLDRSVPMVSSELVVPSISFRDPKMLDSQLNLPGTGSKNGASAKVTPWNGFDDFFAYSGTSGDAFRCPRAQ